MDDATGQYPTLLQLDAEAAAFELKIGRAPFFLCIYFPPRIVPSNNSTYTTLTYKLVFFK